MFWKKRQPKPPPKKIPLCRVMALENGKFGVQEYKPELCFRRILWGYRTVAELDTQEQAQDRIIHLERRVVALGTKLMINEQENS